MTRRTPHGASPAVADPASHRLTPHHARAGGSPADAAPSSQEALADLGPGSSLYVVRGFPQVQRWWGREQ